MRNAKAIYHKQLQSLLKNPGMIVQAVIFLILVIAITFLIGDDTPVDCDSCIPAYVCETCAETNAPLDTPNPSLAGLFVVMFVGFAVVGSASALVMEDKNTQNLRFMKMADVKPYEYLVGTAVSMFAVILVILILYALVGRYFGADMLWFMAATASGALVSVLLGLVVGLSKAPGLATLFSMVFGLGPMLSSFNETLARLLRFTYTQQVNLAVSGLDGDLSTNFIVIAANGAVVLAYFIWMHRKGNFLC